MKILIVEHDPMAGMLEQEGLAVFGHEIIGPAFDADAAREAANLLLIDLAIVNVNLARQDDGIILAADLRDRFGIPCMLVGSHPKLRDKFIPFATAYLPKPYLFAVLERSARLVRGIADGHSPINGSAPVALQILNHFKIERKSRPIHD